MKIFILLIMSLSFSFSFDNQDIFTFSQKYTKSNKTNIHSLAYDFANSSISFNKLESWDKQRFRSINKKELNESIKNNTQYNYILNLINKSPEYIRLLSIVKKYYEHEEEFKLVTPHLYRPLHYGGRYYEIINLKKYLTLIQNSDFEYMDEEYDDQLSDEISIFQERHGLFIDGKIGPQTRKELNMSFEEIVNKLKINLEIEMSKKDKPSEYIYINIPEFKMYYIKDDTELLSMNVIVGKIKNKTPIFNENMRYVVINPEWNVPDSIYNKEYSKKSKKSLSRRGFKFNKKGKLVQMSGERNALGLVKFMFPNKFSVYMHDTPNKKLFDRNIRAFSHGCVRLEDPFSLLDELGLYYSDEENEEILLDYEIPVYIEYNTAWIDSDGILQFRPDIYNYEKKLFK